MKCNDDNGPSWKSWFSNPTKYSRWVALVFDYHAHGKRLFDFAWICCHLQSSNPQLSQPQEGQLENLPIPLVGPRPHATAGDQLGKGPEYCYLKVSSRNYTLRFWDNVTWPELDTLISGPRTVMNCEPLPQNNTHSNFDSTLHVNLPFEKKTNIRLDLPPLPENLRPFVEATTSGPASGVWSNYQWHCSMSPVVTITLNSDGFQSFYLYW